FKDADEKIDRAAEIEENGRAFAKTDRRHAEHVRERHGDQSERQREIQIARRRTKQRNRFSSLMDDDRAHAWQKPEPVRKKHEKENREDERQVFLGRLPVAKDRIHKAK